MVEIHKIYTLHLHIRGTECPVILIMDIVNHSTGLITSYHTLDAVVTGMITLPNDTNTNTISGVLCISDTLL